MYYKFQQPAIAFYLNLRTTNTDGPKGDHLAKLWTILWSKPNNLTTSFCDWLFSRSNQVVLAQNCLWYILCLTYMYEATWGDMWHMTCDMGHVLCDTWHVTRDTWHETCAMFLTYRYERRPTTRVILQLCLQSLTAGHLTLLLPLLCPHLPIGKLQSNKYKLKNTQIQNNNVAHLR